jgi:hypothetical protein
MSSGLPIATATSQLLTLKAWGDFVHDFDDPVRANVTVGVLNTVPIELTSSIKKLYGQLAEKIVAASGKNSATAFQLFRQYFGNTIPPAELPDKVLHENDITALAGINYTWIVSQLKADTASKIKPMVGSFLGGLRNYEIHAATEKIGGKHQHMVSCLNSLSGRTEIVLMWDAGACEISEVGATFDASAVIPGFDTEGTYDIYFINSKENLSDPAPKPTFDTLSTKNPNVNIYFLEEWDPTETTIYPAWPTTAAEFAATQGDQNTNLYSGYRLITKRGAGKTVSGTLFTNSGGRIEIADIKETSKVANAVTTAVLDMLLGKTPEEFMSPILLKRAGDWCQALTLLDRSRRYRITPSKGNTMRGGGHPLDVPVTLADFEQSNALIALITNDRVLLAFAIALGLHVLFTNVRNGINWLLLFQNTDSGRVDDKDAVQAKAVATYAAIDGDLARLTGGIQTLQGKVNEGLGTLISSFDLTSLLIVRDAIYRLTRLPSAPDIVAAKNVIWSTAEGIQKGAPLALGLGVLRSINSRIDAARDIAEKLLAPTDPIYPDVATEAVTLGKLNEVWSSGAVIPPTADLYIQYQTIIDKLAADVAKLPPGSFSPNPLPDDSVLQDRLTAMLGRAPQMSRASRAMPALTALGLLFRYFNTRFNLGAQTGGHVFTGGAKIAVDFETAFLIPRLLDSKTIVSYTAETASTADAVDATMFIAKEDNYVQNIDGTYTTVVDGFITSAFDFESMEEIFSTPAFSVSYPTPVDGMRAALTQDKDLAYPLVYVLIKGLLTSLDILYEELLGIQSLEYSNFDALKDLAFAEQSIRRIGDIVNTVHLRDPLTDTHIATFIAAYYTLWIKDAEEAPESPDAILETLMVNAYSEGGQALVRKRYDEQYPQGDAYGFDWFLEEEGPQLAYDSRVAGTISKLLTNRGVLIDTFSTPFFVVGSQTLADYSRYLEDIPKLPADAATNVPFAILEDTITNSFTAQSGASAVPEIDPRIYWTGGGGLQARRSLYKKHVEAPRMGGRRGLYEGLRQRTGAGATARVRQLPIVSRTRRQRKHVGRV